MKNKSTNDITNGGYVIAVIHSKWRRKTNLWLWSVLLWFWIIISLCGHMCLALCHFNEITFKTFHHNFMEILIITRWFDRLTPTAATTITTQRPHCFLLWKSNFISIELIHFVTTPKTKLTHVRNLHEKKICKVREMWLYCIDCIRVDEIKLRKSHWHIVAKNCIDVDASRSRILIKISGILCWHFRIRSWHCACENRELNSTIDQFNPFYYACVSQFLTTKKRQITRTIISNIVH